MKGDPGDEVPVRIAVGSAITADDLRHGVLALLDALFTVAAFTLSCTVMVVASPHTLSEWVQAVAQVGVTIAFGYGAYYEARKIGDR